LTAIPGVGRKTAERVVVELRDKIAALALTPEEEPAGARAASAARGDIRDDTISALIALGYQRAQAERAVSAAIGEEGERSIEAVLKRALRRLSR
jgi:Holliday junction DNA helicase RuvA